MTLRTSITRRERKRVLTSGITVRHSRYVLNYRDPRTGKRRQLFFPSQREAIARRDAILAAIATNSYRDERASMTVAGVIEHWLENRKSEVKLPTWENLPPALVQQCRRSAPHWHVGRAWLLSSAWCQTGRHPFRRCVRLDQDHRFDHRRH